MWLSSEGINPIDLKLGQTKMAQEAANAKELQKQFQQELTAKETAANKDRTGKGLRVRFGQTRGRNPKVVD